MWHDVGVAITPKTCLYMAVLRRFAVKQVRSKYFMFSSICILYAFPWAHLQIATTNQRSPMQCQWTTVNTHMSRHDSRVKLLKLVSSPTKASQGQGQQGQGQGQANATDVGRPFMTAAPRSCRPLLNRGACFRTHCAAQSQARFHR